MKVLTEVIFYVIDWDVRPDMSNKWVDGQVVNAELMNNRRKAKIKFDGDYYEKIAGPSSLGYASYVNPDFISRGELNKDEIIIKHHENISAGWHKYNDKLDYVFETVDGVPAKRYKDIIRHPQTVQHYAQNVAKKLLPFTGDKIRGGGCAVNAMRWLDGDTSISEGAGIKMVKGSPLVIARPGLRSTFRSGFEQRLTKAGALIVRAKFQDKDIERQNDITNRFMNTVANPDLNLVPFETGGDSHVDYIKADPDKKDTLFRMEIKVSQKTS